ncbi:COX15/CtaA family protein [Pseudofulvibacter geojedonensis]|uniref:Heme A synthase n=1 Tax=Pseudofulvibacter geojedonensis TaxID=1123758 RepID=A0ABW3HZJ4_9FLAO
MQKHFHKLAKISIVCVYLIIIAGAVVRMTGSGMGCPDWPKCFGYYIPPTEISDIQFKPNHSYKEGHVIQVNDLFYFANKDFTTGDSLNLKNWQKNTKHEYNSFNPTHTWIEFINRLFTAVAGIPILILFIVSVFLWKDKKYLTIAAFLVILGMGFEAWLGKTVVDSNLLPYKISIHMAGSFFIIAMLLYCIYKSKEIKSSFKPVSLFKNVLIFSLLLTLIQVYIGTQVRQFVDEQAMVNSNAALWLENPNLAFYIHRTLSILVFIVNAWLFIQLKKQRVPYKLLNYIMIVLGLEIITGIVIYYFNFPFTTQPLHLLLAAVLFGLQFYIMLQVMSKPKSQTTN